MFQAFVDADSDPAIRGFLHEPAGVSGNVLVLTHGAGGNCQAKVLVETAEALAEAGWTVLRCDLPFRQQRAYGPPPRGSAERDRVGLRRAVTVMREKYGGRVFLGGHSYGGRQASILAAEEPQLVEGLLLLSYPLHPPKRPKELRTAHFKELKTAAVFVHGTKDPFATSEEIAKALKWIPADCKLLEVEGVGHELRRKEGGVVAEIVKEFAKFVG